MELECDGERGEELEPERWNEVEERNKMKSSGEGKIVEREREGERA